MSSSDKLKEYHDKRDFQKTSEPEGKKNKGTGEPVFVIQKHDASNLHYDLRLEVGGVLRSWAVPKGPSTDPKVKRLAVPTEDHPLEYADFEGIIPQGQYGGGTVLVWDNGTYENISEKDGNPISIEEAIKKGHFKIRLAGKKLKGGYSFIRTSGGKGERWLLVKMKDDHADPGSDIVSTEPDSVLSGRTIEEIAKEG